MTRICVFASVLWLTGCDGSVEPPNDPPPSDMPDAAAIDAVPLPDVDLASCQVDRLRFVIADRPLVVGDYCDDVQLCASDTAAASIAAIAPGFDCDTPDGGCPAGLRRCTWYDADEIDTAEYASLCQLVPLVDEPEIVRCYVYL